MNGKIIVTGVNGALSKDVAHWLKAKNCDVSQISLRDNNWKVNGFKGVSCIVHIAGVTPQNAKSEDDYEKVNHLLTRDLAETAKNDGVKHFVYISSMAVYGIEQSLDIKRAGIERETACNPHGEYGISKLNAEKCLYSMENDSFGVTIIRVPSIYGKGKTEYLDQYKYLAEKLPVIPYVFEHCYKSAIYVDNLCELIYLTVKNNYIGLICPDDGAFSAMDFCSAIYPSKKKSKLLGIAIRFFLKNNDRIIDYYGAIYYSENLTNVFDGKYRVVEFNEAVRRAYEK